MSIKMLLKHNLPLVKWKKNKIFEAGKFEKVPMEQWAIPKFNREEREFIGCNVAVKMGHEFSPGKFLHCVDFDFKKPEGVSSYERFLKLFPDGWQNTVSSETESGGLHYWFWHTEALRVSIALFPGVDFLGLGSLSTEPPSQFFEANKPCNQYRWITEPTELELIKPLPDWIINAHKLRNTPFEEMKKIERGDFAPVNELELEFFRWQLFCYIPTGGLQHNEWIQIGMSLHYATDGSDSGYDLWNEWSARVQEVNKLSYNEKRTKSSWESFGRYIRDNPITIGFLIRKLSQENAAKNNQFLEDLNAWAIEEIKKNPSPPETTQTKKDGNKKKENKEDNNKKEMNTDEYCEIFERLLQGKIRKNQCSNKLELHTKGIKFPMSDGLEAQIILDFRKFSELEKIPQFKQANLVKLIILASGEKHMYNPLKDYFQTCLDKYKAQLGTLEYTDIEFPKYYYRDLFVEGLKLKNSTKEEQKAFEWFRDCFRFWLEGMVAKFFFRYQNPMLVLQGDQGTGKSSLARCVVKNTSELTPGYSYFKEGDINPENKDHRIALTQTLVWEVPELGATTRKSDVDRLKAFITSETIDERGAYARNSETRLAIASFIGSSNEDAFLRDATGARRFLVCDYNPVDKDYTINYLRSVADPDLMVGESFYCIQSTKQPMFCQEMVLSQSEMAEKVRVKSDLETWLEDEILITGKFEDAVKRSLIRDNLKEAQIREKSAMLFIQSWLKRQGIKEPEKKVNGERYFVGCKLRSTVNTKTVDPSFK